MDKAINDIYYAGANSKENPSYYGEGTGDSFNAFQTREVLSYDELQTELIIN